MGSNESNSGQKNQINQLNKINQSIKISQINLIKPIDNDKFPKIVVGIDFGTAGIGYAYSLCDNKKNIILSDLQGQCDNKVPTEIILDNEFKFILAFGNECSNFINTHYNKNEYQYFKNIKMNLYKKNNKIKSTNGKEIEIKTIITKILKKVSDEAMNQINRNNKKNILT